LNDFAFFHFFEYRRIGHAGNPFFSSHRHLTVNDAVVAAMFSIEPMENQGPESEIHIGL
jgi:hypothetical protein